MAIIHWKIATSGDFNTASNWNPAVVPGSGDDAIIDAVGTYTVTSSTTNTVHALAIVATATLAIGSGTSFSITSGSGTGGIAGTVSVANGAVLSLAGSFTGTGRSRRTLPAARLISTWPAPLSHCRAAARSRWVTAETTASSATPRVTS